MKSKILALVVIFLFGSVTLFAATKNEKVDVKGNCGMCKTNIEKAAKGVAGVTKADWDQKTNVLNLAYDDAKTDLKAVETAIAKVGYDTPLVKATDEAYKALPGCCQYDRSGKKTASGSCEKK